MRIVQALHWLHDMLPADSDSILKKIRKTLEDPKQGKAIRDDLRGGLDALPTWLRDLVSGLIHDSDHSRAVNRKSTVPSSAAISPIATDDGPARPAR
jgi:hypothetical protein